MPLVKGEDLTLSQRREVLAAFIFRWTSDNPHRLRVYRCPHCDLVNLDFGKVGCRQYHPTILLQTDEEWIREHAFYVNARGCLAANKNHCEPAFMAEKG